MCRHEGTCPAQMAVGREGSVHYLTVIYMYISGYISQVGQLHMMTHIMTMKCPSDESPCEIHHVDKEDLPHHSCPHLVHNKEATEDTQYIINMFICSSLSPGARNQTGVSGLQNQQLSVVIGGGAGEIGYLYISCHRRYNGPHCHHADSIDGSAG